MNRKSVMAVALAVVAVLVLWYQFVWSPKGDDLDSARQARTTAEQSRDRVRQQLAIAQQQNQGNDAQIQAQRQQLEAAIPAKPDLEGFIRAAYDIKQKAGVDWVSIQPNQPSAGSGGTEISMQILVRGGYFQVLDYLNRLEDLKRVVVIDGISLATGDSGAGASGDSTTATTTGSSNGAPTLSVTLTARMFTQASASSLPGTGSGGTTPTTPTTAAGTATTAGGTN